MKTFPTGELRSFQSIRATFTPCSASGAAAQRVIGRLEHDAHVSPVESIVGRFGGPVDVYRRESRRGTGAAGQSGGTFTLVGGGADIWGTSDAFHYVYTPMSGGVYIETRVASMKDPAVNYYSRAGIMIRESTAVGSKQVSLMLHTACYDRLSRPSAPPTSRVANAS